MIPIGVPPPQKPPQSLRYIESNFMGKFPSFPHTNPNPNPRKQNHHPFVHHHHNGVVSGGDCNNRTPSSNGFAAPMNHRGNGGTSYSHYVNFDVSEYSRSEKRKLKAQLVSELGKVRDLASRISSGDVRNVSVSKKRPFPFGNKEMSAKRTANGKLVQDQEEKEAVPVYEASAGVMSKCGTVLRKLISQKGGPVFDSPVDVVGMGLYDYHTIIKKPMDLGTIQKGLEKGVYPTPEEFAADVRLTFNNALLYNPKGHEVNTLAEQYLALFEKWYKPIYQKFLSEKEQHFIQSQQQKQQQQIQQRQQTPPVVPVAKSDFREVVEDEVQGSSWSKIPSPEPPKVSKPETKPDPPPALPPPVVPVQRREPSPVVAPGLPVMNEGSGRGRGGGGKLPKPKAKDPNKRDMSMEEKHKLGAGLQSLPEEKMAQVIQIIRKRNGHLTQDGDEIELDIEAVDKETLWELDRFVVNYKKMVSKIRRQALMDMQNNGNAGLSDDTNQGEMSERMMVEMSKVKKGGGGDVGEEDVDIGDEMPVNHFPPVQIDKDDDRQPGGGGASDSSSSSGSSSSDNSSSSDSDSGSSSGSDSDVDDAQSRDNESKNFHH